MSEAAKVGKISAIVNLAMTILKFVAGVFASSTALIADALHSLVDVLGSLLVWVGIRVAEKPADVQHPYGHFKAESLAELGVGLIIVASSLSIMYEAANSLMFLQRPSFEFYAVAVAAVSAAVNEALARYKISVGVRVKSSSLVAEGKHSRADVVSSLAVVIGFFFVYAGYWWADAVVAFIISAIILQMGFGIIKSAVDVLMDRVDEEVALKVRSLLEKIDGVEAIEFIAARGTWRSKVIEVRFSVNPGMDAATLDAIRREVEEEVKERIPGVVRVIATVSVKKPKVAAIPEDCNGRYTGDIASPCFTIVNFDSGDVRRIKNPHASAERRKGMLIAELLSGYGVNVVAVKKIGEGARAHMRSVGIIVWVTDADSVSEVVEKLRNHFRES